MFLCIMALLLLSNMMHNDDLSIEQDNPLTNKITTNQQRAEIGVFLNGLPKNFNLQIKKLIIDRRGLRFTINHEHGLVTASLYESVVINTSLLHGQIDETKINESRRRLLEVNNHACKHEVGNASVFFALGSASCSRKL